MSGKFVFPVSERRKERALRDEYFDVHDEMPELVDTSDDEGEPAPLRNNKPRRTRRWYGAVSESGGPNRQRRRSRSAVCESGGSHRRPRCPRVGAGHV